MDFLIFSVKYTISNTKNINFETTHLACPWILGILMTYHSNISCQIPQLQDCENRDFDCPTQIKLQLIVDFNLGQILDMSNFLTTVF